MKKRIATVVGARPQFIKAACLSRLFKDHSQIEEILIHTGQHYDAVMSDVFFDELKIPKPSHSLNVYGGLHGQMTGHMLEAVEKVFIKEKPDAVLVYGDTNSTLAGALAASKLHIPVIHVEAGLRSYNKQMPEETNRVLTDHVSALLFCPTQTAVNNLIKEGISKGVRLVGDVMNDATLYAIEKTKENVALEQKFDFLPNRYAVMTVHRAESTQSLDKFQKIVAYAGKFSIENGLKIVFPVHPRTQKLVDELPKFPESIMLIDPLSYFETQYLLANAKYVLTDSGGLQKEAYFHRIPCITLRSETEWVETIEAGWNRLWTVDNYHDRSEIIDYGQGDASLKITKEIETFLGLR
ncbi:MAG: UDP-N-acetylglucosamine 2-epimerase (non-hydrolyzing) [Alphaproteobacteria bacterium]|nr:UDP-N-acetylglucosamine 2-epimerase (non-hydrolyzing) [Alphaproteobacteria bacterium]